MEVRIVETQVHGRALYEPRSRHRLIAGFHGYAENAAMNLAELQRIPGSETWSLLSIQALHPFYTKKQEVVASWMTREDRELHIDDNVAYAARMIENVGSPATVVFLGFSQGVAMAFRCAARLGAAGVIALGADVPPDVTTSSTSLPPVLLGRGTAEERYTQEKFEIDLAFLRGVTTVTSCLYAGGHEWTDEFRTAAGEFLKTVDAG
jgi:predicted esterase